MTVPSLFSDSDSSEPRAGSAAESALSPDSVPAAGSASLYRKYRPQSFDAETLVGQDHVVRTLRNAILLGKVAHAYLFSGPRGTGKTTTARVLAKAINCLAENPADRPCNACANCRAINANATPDIIEIDAASNRGIDDIRDLRDRVRYAPAQLPSKVYIIDEAHQITGAAANAFLKTLEEPPAHTRFILATTDPEELLPTIVSRCQRFEFRRVGGDAMMGRLRTVAELEGIAVADEALRIIARHATGSLRDALGLLEQLALLAAATDGAASATIAADDVRAVLGLSRNDRVEDLVAALARRDPAAALRVVQDAVDAGEDPRQMNRQLLSYLRLLLAERAGGTHDADDRARELAAMLSLPELAALARRFGEIDFSIKHAPYPQLPLEVALVEAASTAEPSPAAAAPSAPPAPDDTPPMPARPVSLRDRVRAPASIREVPGPPPAPVSRPEPVSLAAVRPAKAPPPAATSGPAAAAPDVEQIAELWPNVRADVKALNRRIEALLSEVDPVAVSGNQITLAAPYSFHRDKLNSDDVRETVAGVLSRLLGREISLVCVLRGELPGGPPAAPQIVPNGPADTPADSAATAEEDERDQARLRAAINIFDAEEI